MTDGRRIAEQMVVQLMESANRSHPGARWDYELTSEVDNIEVAPGPDADSHILRIHPCWLRYVVAQDEFTSCVADEVEAWHLLAALTAGVGVAA
jgi:hypothetical protein